MAKSHFLMTQTIIMTLFAIVYPIFGT